MPAEVITGVHVAPRQIRARIFVDETPMTARNGIDARPTVVASTHVHAAGGARIQPRV